MRAFAAVFSRELFERRLVFPVALGAGFFPLLFTLAIGWSRPNAAEVRVLVVLVSAAAFAVAFGALFGGSVIAGETAERRMSFFFVRPLPAVAIWSGKLLAALVLTLGPALLALLPALLAGVPGSLRSLAPSPGGNGEAEVIFLGGTLFLVLGAHAAVTVARLRSPWIALDALLAGLAAAAIWFLAHVFLKEGVLPPYHVLSAAPVRGFLAVLLGILLTASYVQVGEGRSDARRAHGAFSITLWGLLSATILALGGFAWWVSTARAADLARIDGGIQTSPRGAWLAAGGPLGAGRGAGMFLFDTAGGRSVRIRSGDADFSANGARAAWTEERIGFFEKGRKADLFVADLASAKAVETGLEYSVWCRVALSPSGNRVAVSDGRTLEAYDVSDPSKPKQVAAIRLEDSTRTLLFVDEDTIRLFPRFHNAARKDIAPAALEISELSLPSKKSLVTGLMEREALPHLRISADGRYLVGTKEKRLTLHDGRTGAQVRVLGDDLKGARARFLSGGRIAVAGVADGKGVLKIFLEGENAPAAPTRSIDLGPAASVVLGGEVGAGQVAVALNSFRSNDERSRSAWKLAIVDPSAGRVVSSVDGLVPADRLSWWFSPVLPPAETGSPASKLFLDASGALVRLDPATMKQEVLLGGRR